MTDLHCSSNDKNSMMSCPADFMNFASRFSPVGLIVHACLQTQIQQNEDRLQLGCGLD